MHKKEVDLARVVDNELLEAAGEHVFCPLVAAITNLTVYVKA